MIEHTSRRAFLAAFSALTGASLLAPRDARAQRRGAAPPPPPDIRFAVGTPPLAPTAPVMRAWFNTNGVTRVAQTAATRGWHVYMGVFFARPPGVAQLTSDWYQLGPNGARTQFSSDTFPIEDRAGRMQVRDLNLPGGQGGYEAGFEYEMVLSVPGATPRVLGSARLRLDPP